MSKSEWELQIKLTQLFSRRSPMAMKRPSLSSPWPIPNGKRYILT